MNCGNKDTQIDPEPSVKTLWNSADLQVHDMNQAIPD
jgi:hypothetical protein